MQSFASGSQTLIGQSSIARRGSVSVTKATQVPLKFNTIDPVGDRLLIKTGGPETATATGIVLPKVSQKKKYEGVVEAVGKCNFVKVGDRVQFGEYAGTELSQGEDEFVLVQEHEVLGILNGDSVKDLQPVGDRILVKADKGDAKTKVGVLLQANAVEAPSIGVVVAVGEGTVVEDKTTPLTVKEGATVMYSQYSGVEFEDGDERYVVIKDTDLIAQLE